MAPAVPTLFPVVAILAIADVAGAGGSSGDISSVRAAVAGIHAREQDHAGRLEAVSRLFLGAPYKLSPLGEGPTGKRDRDPLVRFDAFDCVTYVEEVMALGWSHDVAADMPLLQRIRYLGAVGYERRKHIMVAQWIPENVKAGFVRDITRAVAGPFTGSATLVLGPAEFASVEGRKLALLPASRPLGRHRVDIVPVARMAVLSGKVPHGTIITTIRVPRPGVPYLASHVGLVVVRHGQRLVRHADQVRKRVVQEPLSAFVARAAGYTRRRVMGFNLLAIASSPPK